ncbi:hypothetical protein GCK72_013205 [Caenorhabditis remanei]|uniref:Uncharacterized protein n=1 Tax=Caenorhabditis remanei TaxID=31234 RepID=A0A6A5GPZ6_CAERE|nr:hypothetical protein GCK72_013205 [Caenorhabditis remanei]KAF1756751.1 hypothetical protein GCK72_013205 [Caenorhabditis remanei]
MSKASFFIVMNLKDSPLQNYPTAALLLLSSVTGLFGVTLYAISINFIFRYFALQRAGRLRYFAGKFLIVWMVYPFVIAVIAMAVVYQMGPNERMTALLRQDLKKMYDLDIDKATYSGCFYYTIDEYDFFRRIFSKNEVASVTLYEPNMDSIPP